MVRFCLCARGMPREEDDDVQRSAPPASAPPASAPRASAPAPVPARSKTSAVREANPPTWPASVHVIEPDGKFVGDKQALFDQIFSDGGKFSAHQWAAGQKGTGAYGGFFDETDREFDTKRTAVLLKPGAHKANFNVGYYQCLVGLGRAPGAVQLDSFECLNGSGADHHAHGQNPGALCNFWRSVENLQTASGKAIYYFVSQASPLRRCHIQGDLRLCGTVGDGVYDWGWASGGFSADCKVDGFMELGGQQQWLARNNELGDGRRFQHGAWSAVIVGSKGDYDYNPDQQLRVTEVDTTEIIAEKPYIVFEEAQNKYFLQIPRPQSNQKGVSWQGDDATGPCDSVDFELVYVAEAGVSSAKDINAKISQGRHIILTPGIYMLDEPIVVSRSDVVIMGLGCPTLQPSDSAKHMEGLVVVQDGLEGVRISGLMLQAGPAGSDTLLKWGRTKGSANVGNAGFLHDMYCRVGGDRPANEPDVWTDTMVEVNSGGVVGDNLWLWRADHMLGRVGVMQSRNRADHGLLVNGDNVVMYGLFCEHALQDLTVWNGENGRTYFYQCELPYDVTQENFGDRGFVGYRIADHVQTHRLEGAGVYCFFRDHDVHAKTAFKAPEGRPGIRLNNLFTVFLDGSGCIESILNRSGRTCSAASKGRPCFL